jgi:hypothetical protein
MFDPRITSTVGHTTLKRRKASRQNLTPNRSDLPRPQYQNPFYQVMPKHQTQHSEPVNTPVTQFQSQTNLQFQSPIVQNPIQSRVIPHFNLPSNLQSTLQVPSSKKHVYLEKTNDLILIYFFLNSVIFLRMQGIVLLTKIYGN